MRFLARVFGAIFAGTLAFIAAIAVLMLAVVVLGGCAAVNTQTQCELDWRGNCQQQLFKE